MICNGLFSLKVSIYISLAFKDLIFIFAKDPDKLFSDCSSPSIETTRLISPLLFLLITSIALVLSKIVPLETLTISINLGSYIKSIEYPYKSFIFLVSIINSYVSPTLVEPIML